MENLDIIIPKWIALIGLGTIGLVGLIFILTIIAVICLWLFEIYKQRKARSCIPEYKLYYKVANNIIDQNGRKTHLINKDYDKFESLISYFVGNGYINECREILSDNYSNLETLYLFPKGQLSSDVQMIYQDKMSSYYKTTLNKLKSLQTEIKNREKEAAVKDLIYLDSKD